MRDLNKEWAKNPKLTKSHFPNTIVNEGGRLLKEVINDNIAEMVKGVTTNGKRNIIKRR